MPLGQQLNMGQMLQQVNPMALYNAKQAYEQAQGRESQANNLAQGQFGATGLAGILANGIGALLANKRRKTTDSKQSEYAKAQFESNRAKAAQLAQEKARALADERDYNAKVSAQKHAYDMELAGAKKQETTLVRNLISQGLQPGTPEFQQAIQKQMNKTNSPIVNVNSGKAQGAFETALAKKNAEKFNDWESQALASNEILGKLGQMEQISSAQQTGKTSEAMAMAGQWFGSDAGSNLQAFNAIQKDLMLNAASNLKGAMSDGEWRVLQSKMPDFGNDPRANQKIFDILKGAAQRNINRYDNASNYVSENGKLQGFKPKFNFSNNKEPHANQDFSKMSDDELIAAYKAQKGQ